MPKKPLPVYLGLSIKELQGLATVSGEALRLYIAVSAFAMGTKTTCFPKWSQLKEAMGKPNADTRNLKRKAKELEEAGLIKRGEFGSTDRWRLILKEQVQKQRGSNPPPQNDPPTGSNLPPREGKKNHQSGSNLPPVNKKINKKRNKKINNNLIKQTSDSNDLWLSAYDPNEIQTTVGNIHHKDEILRRLERDEDPEFLRNYEDEDLSELCRNETLKPTYPDGISRLKQWCNRTGVFMRLLGG